MAESTSKEEQARRAQALAEKCFLAGNVPAARQWMLSAARLAPALPGVAQALDVHAAAAARRPVDWYAVLGLPHDVFAHDDVKRQHRRLCLLVHPDKNPSAAADGAFKLVQAAWEALSARHPPADDDMAAAAAAPTQPTRRPPPRPPDPPPQPGQRRPPTPPSRGAGAHQGRRRSYADVASAPQPQTAAEPPSLPRAAPRAPPQPSASRCPSGGALTPYGKRSLRCMVCHWGPKGQWWRVGSEFR